MNDLAVAAAGPLRELRAHIARIHAQLSVLERAADVLVAQLTEHSDRCDAFHPESPCSGDRFARWCWRCGATFLRCEADGHGGSRGAAYALDLHVGEVHAGSGAAGDPGDPAAADPGRVSAGGCETLPLGELQAPPAGRSGGKRRAARRAADSAPAQPAAGASRPAGGPGGAAIGPGVIRRAAAGRAVDR